MPPAPIVPLRMGTTEWILLLVLSALWGGSFFFFRVLIDDLPPFTIVLGRVGIAALALNLYLLVRRDPMPTAPGTWGTFLVMGLLNNVLPFTLIVLGETRISSGLASILNATTPVFAVLSAHVLTTTERLTWRRGAGVLFGFAGVAVLIGPDALAGLGTQDLVGELSCLAAAFIYGLAGLYGRRFKGIPPLKVATGQITASTLILLPLAGLVDRPWTLAMPGAGTWAALVGIALISTALAYMLYFRILAVAGCHQPDAGDLPAADQRAAARLAGTRRTTGADGDPRHDHDRPGPRLHRRKVARLASARRLIGRNAALQRFPLHIAGPIA